MYGIHPLDYLGLAPHDFAVTSAAVREADRLTQERANARAKALAQMTGGYTARRLGKILDRVLRQ